jgi:hypothetical protein
MATTDSFNTERDNTNARAEEIITALPARDLWIQTTMTSLFLLAFAGLDAVINWKSVGSSFTLDEYGLDTGNTVVAAGFSLLTVCAWLLVGGIYSVGFRRAVGAAYAFVMVIIGFLIIPVALPFVAERAAALGMDTAPFWFQAFGLCLFTILLSLPGLFLCILEQRLARILHKWKIRAEAVALRAARRSAYLTLDLQSAGALNLIQRKVNRESAVAALLQMVKQEIEANRTHITATAAGQFADPSLSKTARLHAWEKIQAHARGKVGAAVVLSALLAAASVPAATAAPSAVDALLARAPSLLVLLDNTGGSPALEPSILAQAEKSIQEKLARLPMGSSLIVFSVGDPKQIAELKRWRVQAKVTENGGPVAYLKARLHAHLLGFPARQHPAAHKESHLVQGWFDSAQLINVQADTENFVVFVTDAMEFSPLANCYQACKLPKPTFTLPTNTRLEMLGIGYGQSSAKTLAIWPEWKKFFAAAGIVNLQLLHMF